MRFSGTWLVVDLLGWRLDWMILKVFSNLKDFTIFGKPKSGEDGRNTNNWLAFPEGFGGVLRPYVKPERTACRSPALTLGQATLIQVPQYSNQILYEKGKGCKPNRRETRKTGWCWGHCIPLRPEVIFWMTMVVTFKIWKRTWAMWRYKGNLESTITRKKTKGMRWWKPVHGSLDISLWKDSLYSYFHWIIFLSQRDNLPLE